MGRVLSHLAPLPLALSPARRLAGSQPSGYRGIRDLQAFIDNRERFTHFIFGYA